MSQSPDLRSDREAAERAAVIALLGAHHDMRCSSVELRSVVGEIESWTLAVAFERLYEHGVVEVLGDCVGASRSLRRLHALGLRAI